MGRRAATRFALSSIAAAALAAGAVLTPTPAVAAAGSAHHSAHAAAHHHHGHSARHRRHHHHHGISFSGGHTLSSGRTNVVPPQLPAGPCSNADLEPTAANLGLIDEAALCLVNKQRVAHGLVALARNSRLDAAAARESNTMIADDFFDHVWPSGSTPLQRIEATGYIPAGAGYEIGENIATGSRGLDTPAAIVSDWMNSPGHRANILNGDFTETGMAAVAAMPASVGGGLAGGTYTQDFGVIN